MATQALVDPSHPPYHRLFKVILRIRKAVTAATLALVLVVVVVVVLIGHPHLPSSAQHKVF